LELHPDQPADDIARAAGVIRKNAHQALQDLREVIGVLRAAGEPSEEDLERPQPTLVDLPGLVDESRQAGMRVTLEQGVIEPTAVPVAIGRSAYRVVQEGLTNARKHASGADVSVVLRGTNGAGLTVEIRNPWPGTTSALPGAGSGLVGLAERISLAGGRLEHGGAPGGEFRLWAWLPWPA
jgi:signal transduction histidine kinase